MGNDGEMTEVTTSRGAQAKGLRVKLMALLLLAAVFIAGLLLGQSRLSGSESAVESKPASGAGEQTSATNQARLSPEAIKRGQIEIGPVSMHSFSQTLEVSGRLALNEDAAARVGT